MATRAETELPMSWIDEGSDDQTTLLSVLHGNPGILRVIHEIPADLLAMGELAIEKKIRARNEDGTFPRMLGLIKIQFWEDYHNAIRDERQMSQQHWVHGICSRIWFHKNVIHDQLHLAWLLTPPTEELVLQKELIALSLKKLRQVIDADIFTYTSIKDGGGGWTIVKKVDVPLVKEIHSILQTMSNRVYGSVIQRQQIESRNKNITITQHASPISLSSPNLTMDQLEELDRKIKSIKKSMKEVAAMELPPYEGELIEATISKEK